MAKGVVATMDTVGYLKEPTAKADRQIAQWFANRVDQSIIFRDIQSYQYVVGKHQNDFRVDEFLREIQSNLKSYMLECFDGVDVSARAVNYEPGNKMFTLAVSATVEEDGVRYDVSQAVSINGKTYELVNEGRKRNG